MSDKKNFHVYKSSAGSGKTFMLAYNYLKLILSKERPDYLKRILAITFTVKAANEMKERIISYLSDIAGYTSIRKDTKQMQFLLSENLKLGEADIRAKSKRSLSFLIHNYGDFSIMTIDKFTHKLIRSFACDLDLTPDFEIEIDQQRLNELVISKLIDKVGDDKSISNLVLHYLDQRLNENQPGSIETLLSHTLHELSGEYYFLNSANLVAMGPAEILSIIDEINQKINEFNTKISAIGSNALSLISESGLTSNDFYQGMRGIFGYFTYLREIRYNKLKPNTYALATIQEDRWMSGVKNDAVLNVKTQLTQLFVKAAKIAEEGIKIQFLNKLRKNLYGQGLISELKMLMDEVRLQENVRTLGDFYRILASKFSAEFTPFIYERLGLRYNHILIDEFQDTSILQWKTLKPLVINSLSEGNTSIVVGDIKQSIYRFRGGESDQFKRISDPSYEDNLITSMVSEIALSQNFRSAKNIVDFNNKFLDEVLPILSENIQECYKEFTQSITLQNEGLVSFHAIEAKSEKLELLVEQMISRIELLLTGKTYIERDIALLFHRNADAVYAAGQLIEHGHKVVTEESLLINKDLHAVLIIDTLKAHKSPNDEFYLQRWILSLERTGKLSRDYHDLATLTKSNKLSFHKISQLLHLNLNIEELQHANSFMIIRHLIKCFDLDIKEPALQKLLDFALEFETTGIYLEKEFLEHWEINSTRLSIENPEHNDGIKVMTIHKSKGLEFPIVLVYVTESGFGSITREKTWMEGDFGIHNLRNVLADIADLNGTNFQNIYDEEKDKSLLDQLNALYVAFTRARDRLEIFTNKENDEIRHEWLRNMPSWKCWKKISDSELLFVSE